MLIWARNLESKYDNSENLLTEIKFTNVSISLKYFYVAYLASININLVIDT